MEIPGGPELNVPESSNPNNPVEKIPADLLRYSRQIRFSGIGVEGQRKLQASRVLLVGCGALGSVIANTLVRGGVGFTRLVDRDFPERNNLQRQILFDQQDVTAGLPKAIAAANRLRAINSDVEIEPVVGDVDSSNISRLAGDVDLILDGTDNFETRFLVNDFSICNQIPWVFGGCIGAEGQSMTIVPGETPCLACLLNHGPPPPGTAATCDSAGILSPVINLIASVQSAEALKILSGNPDRINPRLTVVDMWGNRMRHTDLSALKESVDCVCCKQRDFAWLEGRRGSSSAVLCGRNAVQLKIADRPVVDLEKLAGRLESLGEVAVNEFLLRFSVDGYVLTLFEDGRAIVGGTSDIVVAKKLYAQFVGA